MTTPALEVNCDGTPPPDPGGGTGPAVPQNLTGTPDQTNDTVFLDWSDVAGATSYNIYGRWLQNGAVVEDEHFVASTTASESLRGPLADNSTYEYWVTSIVDGVESADSERVTVVLGTDSSGGDPDPGDGGGDPGGGGGGTVPVGSDLLFVGDFNTGDFSQWGSVQKKGYNGSASGFGGDYGLSIVGMGAGHETAARFEVRPGDEPSFGGERSEVRNGTDDASATRSGDERWYEMSVFFPDDFPSPANTWFIIMQWHAGSGSPPLALEVGSNDQLRFTNNRSGGRTDLGPITRGQWMDLVLHVQFSSGSDAFAEAWINGVKSSNVHQEPNMSSDANYIKQGIYRGDQGQTHVVYHDGLRITGP